jgi:hypothetical protein
MQGCPDPAPACVLGVVVLSIPDVPRMGEMRGSAKRAEDRGPGMPKSSAQAQWG